ncbi:MAG TPA: hypothetical protein PKY59_09675 [Pyrinomonadaceae bacterium]|nr:hypothetical protein [Pyrinomonadaceae bacterium]
MADQHNLNINQLKMHAPQSPMLAFRPVDTGSPQQDWCKHLQNFPRFRRELEEFSVLGDVVVRIADGVEPKPFERVKILSLEYAVKTLSDETDGREFVRCVKAIASPDASVYELEQIAAFYYGEIRRRGTSEVLTEMGLLGMQMEAVTASVEDREIDFTESETLEQKLTVADERRIEKARKNLSPLPLKTPNFDDEMNSILRRLGNSKITKIRTDEFENYYLSDGNKSVEELDADYMSFEKLEQYDENGVLGFSMSDGQHSVVVYELNNEVDASYLPEHARALAKEMNLIYVGHRIGGAATQKARHFVVAQGILQQELKEMQKGVPALFSTPMPTVDKFSNLPFSNEEFNEWLAAKLDELYPHRTLRSVRRFMTDKSGRLFEYQGTQEVNPDFEEMQYVAGVCQILWSQKQADFHLRSLRRESYQNLYLGIRKCVDTAEVARLKKQAYDDFKEHKKLNLKEFTSLNTLAKSQEVRLAGKTSQTTRKTLLEINAASANRLRYLKYFLYNDAEIQVLTRQEKQQLWDAVRARETALKATAENRIPQTKQTVQPSFLQRQPNIQKQVVRVTPRSV